MQRRTRKNKKVIISQRALQQVPSVLRSVIVHARAAARHMHVNVYLVGGCVRDFLLKRPTVDLDIVVEEDGIAFAHQLAKRVSGTVMKHRAFGTATITLNDGYKVDIATSRQESYPQPAALPVVKPGSISSDLRRRDFTINALACCMGKGRFGEVIDLFSGVRDLRSGCIRYLHAQSFVDDPLRIMRAVRFEQRLGFRIEKQTVHAIRTAHAHAMLEKVQPHRLRDELILLFQEARIYAMLRRLHELYNVTFIDKKLRVPSDMQRVCIRIDSVYRWFKERFPDHRAPELWLMRLAYCVSTIPSMHLKRMLARYAFRKGEVVCMVSFTRAWKRIDKKLDRKHVSALQLHALLDPLSYEIILLALAATRKKRVQERIREFFLKHHHKTITITGKDLLAFGVEPGPRYRVILRKIFQAKISGRVYNRQEELELAKKIIHTL